MNIKFWRKQQKRSVDTGAGAGKAIQAPNGTDTVSVGKTKLVKS